MNYELARELKGNGFPQAGREYYWDYDRGGACLIHRQNENFWADTSYYCACPTLSELIEECGDSFGALERLNFAGKVKFMALEPRNKQTIPWLTWVDSAEEAVALLYLALNKK